MKVSEAKSLQRGDSVFIFVGMRRVEARVLDTFQESNQKVSIHVQYVDDHGSHFELRRPQTAAYLTKSTSDRIARDQRCPSRDRVELNPALIPGDIIMAANKMSEWMQRNGHRHWKLLGIQSRED